MVGKTISHYEVIEKLGEGGMGVVYKARDAHLDRYVAIKLLPPEKVADPERKRRFVQEAKAASALNHPNIVTVHDIDQSDGVDFIAMEYVEGKTLDELIGRKGMRLNETLKYGVQIADALAKAHAAGIVHRDLKPGNVMVTGDGRAKVLDFGLAKLTEASPVSQDGTTQTEQPKTESGLIVGTVSYMSPEQAEGKQVDARSDIFSFGSLLYEMLTGRRAFRRDSPALTLAAILHLEPPPLPAGIPSELERIIARCLRKDPARRLQTMADLKVTLEELKEDSESGELHDVTKPETKRPWRWPWAAALAVAVAVLLFWPLPPGEPTQVVPFATEARIQTMPRWSPKGDRIAYVADSDGVLQVFTRSLGSSTPTQITHEPESSWYPLWSGDASRIYYLTGLRPHMQLRSVAVAGGTAATLIENAFRFDLSPDGKTLAVFLSDSPGSYRLAFASPPEAPPKPYALAPFSDFRTVGVSLELGFNPSGKYLAVAGTMATQTEFWSIPLDGGAPREYPALRGTVAAGFTFEDSGRIIVGTQPSQLNPQLVSIQTGSGARRFITAGSSRQMHPSMARDGVSLAFASGEVDNDIVEVPLDGSVPREIIATARSEVSPAWAPDGVRFAYVTDRNGSKELWLRNRSDGSERLIAGSGQFPGANSFLDLAISPDGSRVAYRVGGGEMPAIWISPLSGEPPVRLWDDPDPQRGPSWSPDGNSIAYYGIQEGKAAVMTFGIGRAAPPKILASMLKLNPVRWSPRGDWILYRDGDLLRVVSPDGKQNRVMSQMIWEVFGWSKEGSRILGITRGANRRLLLQQVDVDSGRETRIADLGPVPPELDLGDALNEFPYRGFSLHPDGKSFLTSVLRIKTGIYLMKDFDRPERLIDRLLQR